MNRLNVISDETIHMSNAGDEAEEEERFSGEA